ncbi:MAG: hypothetical protein VX366_07965 [Candidatus Thermoplasmatota archaeon]|nr:hypothetical protein [Candidatus Thermoplasmatota archaeon]
MSVSIYHFVFKHMLYYAARTSLPIDSYARCAGDNVRRIVTFLIVALVLPISNVSGDEIPFDFFMDEEVIVHPNETVEFRISWHNIVGYDRHFLIELNNSHQNLTVEGLPDDWTQVESGRLGDIKLNLTVLEDSQYETISLQFLITCQEVSDWRLVQNVDVVVSKWSSLKFGANDGSSFYVQQNVNTSLAVNISNSAGYDDFVKLNIDTDSSWEYGFDDDVNGDGELYLQINDGEDIFINFWIMTPSIQNGAPLAGTGPGFSLNAESSLDRKVVSWNFQIEMQTYHNMTVDMVGENLSIAPGETDRLEVKVRNNGNVETYLDTTLRLGNIIEDRIESEGWTIALFNAFEFNPLQPNESRTFEIGFEAPNSNQSKIDFELIVEPEGFPQRSIGIPISSNIEWNRSGQMEKFGNSCSEVNWNETCDQMLTIVNTGNFYEQYYLRIKESSGMIFEINSTIFGLSKGEQSHGIPLEITPNEGADGYSQGFATVELVRIDGVVLQSLSIESSTAPYINWILSAAENRVEDGELKFEVTMRNEGNIPDGLIVRMASSYYTELSFIPPNNAVYEEGVQNIRSFEIMDVEKGSDFTFSGWAKIPDNQVSSDVFFLNITAHSRLASDNPFTYSVNTTFDAIEGTRDEGGSVVASLGDLVVDFLVILWTLKYVIIAVTISGLMINKSLRDRAARLEQRELNRPREENKAQPGDWMAEFSKKKQPIPTPAESPEIPSETFKGMFTANAGEWKPTPEPVDSTIVSAASSVIDQHEKATGKSKLDSLASEISSGNISKPHHSNVVLPTNAAPVTDRTVKVNKQTNNVSDQMYDVDDLDL